MSQIINFLIFFKFSYEGRQQKDLNIFLLNKPLMLIYRFTLGAYTGPILWGFLDLLFALLAMCTYCFVFVL